MKRLEFLLMCCMVLSSLIGGASAISLGNGISPIIIIEDEPDEELNDTDIDEEVDDSDVDQVDDTDEETATNNEELEDEEAPTRSRTRTTSAVSAGRESLEESADFDFDDAFINDAYFDIELIDSDWVVTGGDIRATTDLSVYMVADGVSSARLMTPTSDGILQEVIILPDLAYSIAAESFTPRCELDCEIKLVRQGEAVVYEIPVRRSNVLLSLFPKTVRVDGFTGALTS